MHTFPTLYGDSVKGTVKEYRVYVLENPDGTCSIVREHGQMGGKMQQDVKVVSSGKNIGKANETSVLEQALSEAKSMWQKKKDNNYTETPGESGKNLLPMLAQKFVDAGHRMKYPAFAQIKLNGVRCLARREGDKIFFTSRKNKSYDSALPHLVQPLLSMMKDGEIYDGEIYIHGVPFQMIASWVKKLRPESTQLQYWVYDKAIEGVPFSERLKQYWDEIPDEHPLIVKVMSYSVLSPEEVKPLHDTFYNEGYEGIILRNRDGLYLFDHRSADLQKYKIFEDAEFKIVGGRTAETGRYAGGCIFKCVTKEGKEFEVCPRGTMQIRKQYYQDLPKLIGKDLTVRYQELSKDGIPIFPVAICVRDFE